MGKRETKRVSDEGTGRQELALWPSTFLHVSFQPLIAAISAAPLCRARTSSARRSLCASLSSASLGTPPPRHRTPSRGTGSSGDPRRPSPVPWEAPGGDRRRPRSYEPCPRGSGGLPMRSAAAGFLRARPRRHGRPPDALRIRRIPPCPAPEAREAVESVPRPRHPCGPRPGGGREQPTRAVTSAASFFSRCLGVTRRSETS